MNKNMILLSRSARRKIAKKAKVAFEPIDSYAGHGETAKLYFIVDKFAQIVGFHIDATYKKRYHRGSVNNKHMIEV